MQAYRDHCSFVSLSANRVKMFVHPTEACVVEPDLILAMIWTTGIHIVDILVDAHIADLWMAMCCRTQPVCISFGRFGSYSVGIHNRVSRPDSLFCFCIDAEMSHAEIVSPSSRCDVNHAGLAYYPCFVETYPEWTCALRGIQFVRTLDADMQKHIIFQTFLKNLWHPCTPMISSTLIIDKRWCMAMCRQLVPWMQGTCWYHYGKLITIWRVFVHAPIWDARIHHPNGRFAAFQHDHGLEQISMSFTACFLLKMMRYARTCAGYCEAGQQNYLDGEFWKRLRCPCWTTCTIRYDNCFGYRFIASCCRPLLQCFHYLTMSTGIIARKFMLWYL